LQSGDDKRDDCERCDSFRGKLVELSNFQLGWHANNRESLESSKDAPSWIHMDGRRYSRKYLDEKYFVKSPADNL